MHSSELAALAGVTVRALRHYHQIGLLDEPTRSASGYRVYDVAHLVRLLRIARLTALGVPLASLPAVLDGPEAATRILDVLDGEAAAEIDRLIERRARIATLRRTGAEADLPPELAEFASLLASEPSARRIEREYLLLLSHLTRSEGASGIAAVFGQLATLEPGHVQLAERFYAIREDEDEEAVDLLVEELVRYYRTMVGRLYADERDCMLDGRGEGLLVELGERHLSPRQREVIARFERQIDGGQPGDSSSTV